MVPVSPPPDLLRARLFSNATVQSTITGEGPPAARVASSREVDSLPHFPYYVDHESAEKTGTYPMEKILPRSREFTFRHHA
jgi:hypothetical protein